MAGFRRLQFHIWIEFQCLLEFVTAEALFPGYALNERQILVGSDLLGSIKSLIKGTLQYYED